MTSTAASKRVSQGAGTAKALIMAVSLGIMVGGWGALAAGQATSTTTAASVTQPVVDASPSAPAPTLRQVTAPPSQSRPVARTRSSR